MGRLHLGENLGRTMEVGKWEDSPMTGDRGEGHSAAGRGAANASKR